MSAPPEPANGAAMKPDPGAPSPAPAQRPVPARARPAAAKKEEPDEGPAQPTTYRDIPLYSTDLRGWSHHIMKFASHTRVDPSDKTQFIPPVKLNRKNPPRPRQPPPEPGMPILDRYGKPMLGPDGKPLVYPKPGEEDPATTAALQTLQQGSSTSKSPAADPSLIAPAGNALRNQQNRFKKRVREVFKAPEQQRRWRREEYLPWVLEDFETSMGWESTRAPQPGPAASAEAGPSVAATIKAESERAKGHAPWIGRMEGGAEGGNYVLFVFDERDAGGFKVVPASRMYRFMQKPGYATLSLDEAEDQVSSGPDTKLHKDIGPAC